MSYSFFGGLRQEGENEGEEGRGKRGGGIVACPQVCGRGSLLAR